MSFQAVLFDLDGTLLNTLADLGDSMNAVLARQGFPQHDLAAYKYFVGEGMANLVRRALPEARHGDEVVSRCIAEMGLEYGRRWRDKTRPYAGVPELLDGLAARGIKLAVLSNKPDDMTRLAVRELLPRVRFDEVRGEREDTPRKPDPASALEIARQLGVQPEAFLYLGDTGTDMLTAKAAGMYPVGALWGFRTAEELSANGAQALLSQPHELLWFL